MATRFYENDKQFNQEALVFVALALNEQAGLLISDGNIAEAEEIALFELINIARKKSLDSSTLTVLGMYANLVQEENEQMRIAFRKSR